MTSVLTVLFSSCAALSWRQDKCCVFPVFLFFFIFVAVCGCVMVLAIAHHLALPKCLPVCG